MAGNDRGLAARAAWLSFIGGYTQEEIAQRLGLSRVKINRLIAEATEAGLVRVFVEGTAAECVALEDRIAAHWKLDFCSVSPTVDRGLLRVGTWEILWNEEVPDAVAVSEAVTLAEELSTDESPSFVNGLLARIVELKPTLLA